MSRVRERGEVGDADRLAEAHHLECVALVDVEPAESQADDLAEPRRRRQLARRRHMPLVSWSVPASSAPLYELAEEERVRHRSSCGASAS